jgi:transposase
MKYVGADLHKKSITFCVVELRGRKTVLLQNRKILCQHVDQIQSFFTTLGEFQVTVEATIGYDWFASLASKYAQRVVVAHAGKLRIIAESTRKTDKIDARILADFLARDMIPEAWRPTDRVRQHRSLVRRRRKLSSRVTSIRNTIRGMLTRYNLDRQDLFTKVGRQAALKMKLLTEEAWLIEDLFDDLGQTEQRLRKVEMRLAEFAHGASTAEQEARALLATFPQMGPITTEIILAELGDWGRFRNANAVVAFAGLDPGVRASDEKRKSLRLSKAGSPLLRWVLIQLTHRLKTRSRYWNRIYQGLQNRIGNKKATCAIARRLLLVIYAMLRDTTAYQLVKAA